VGRGVVVVRGARHGRCRHGPARRGLGFRRPDRFQCPDRRWTYPEQKGRPTAWSQPSRCPAATGGPIGSAASGDRSWQSEQAPSTSKRWSRPMNPLKLARRSR
jgi:hypothetical protein